MLINELQERVVELGVFVSLFFQLIILIKSFAEHIGPIHAKLVLIFRLIFPYLFLDSGSKLIFSDIAVTRREMPFHERSEVALDFFLILRW